MEKEYLPVVIPYLSSDAQGNELELAVAGWREHFLSKYKIFIVGDRHPVVDTGDDIEYIPCPRLEPPKDKYQYRPHLDILNKFREFLRKEPKAKCFIYACDDMYAVRDFTVADIAALKVCEKEIPKFDWKKEGGWLGDLGKTRELCKANGFPMMNWVCHLPVVYDVDRLVMLVNHFDGFNESYVWENIYFNYEKALRDEFNFSHADTSQFLFPDPELVPSTGSKWKYEVKTANPGIASTDDANAIWITNANCGWSKRLEILLREHYSPLYFGDLTTRSFL